MLKSAEVFVISEIQSNYTLTLLRYVYSSGLQALAPFASDPKEADRLRHLALPAGKDEYHDWVTVQNRSLLEVLLTSDFLESLCLLGSYLASCGCFKCLCRSCAKSPWLTGGKEEEGVEGLEGVLELSASGLEYSAI